jgi:hypothetical protein
MIIIKVQFEAEDLAEQFRPSFQGLLQQSFQVLPGARPDHAQPGANLSRYHQQRVSTRNHGARDRKERRVGRVSSIWLPPAHYFADRAERSEINHRLTRYPRASPHSLARAPERTWPGPRH